MRENSETRVGKKTKKENQKIEIETKVTRASPPSKILLSSLPSLPRDGEKKTRIVGRTRVSTLVTRQVRGHGGREHTIHSQHERYKPIPSLPVSGLSNPTCPSPSPSPVSDFCLRYRVTHRAQSLRIRHQPLSLSLPLSLSIHPRQGRRLASISIGLSRVIWTLSSVIPADPAFDYVNY